MKFAQYLQDTQTPEWKKAYIDYRGLKKRITAIRKAQQGLNIHVSSGVASEEFEQPNGPRPSDVGTDDIRSLHEIDRPASLDYGHEHSMSLDKPTSLFGQDNEQQQTGDKAVPARFPRRPSVAGRMSFTLPNLRTKAAKTFSTRLSIGGTAGSGNGTSLPHPNPLQVLPLHELLTHLSPHEVSFFTMLDAQLDKVESFYLAREKEMQARGQLLRMQLKELDEHRRLFLETANPPWASGITTRVRSLLGLQPTKFIRTETWESQRTNNFKPSTASIKRPIDAHIVHTARVDWDLNRAHGGASSALNVAPNALAPISLNTDTTVISIKRPRGEDNCHEPSSTNNIDPEARTPSSDSGEPLADSTVFPHSSSSDNGKSQYYPHISAVPLSADPDSYLYAKRKLKRAVIEHYRGLEMLHNYRVLNITGFRKALKKFEKVTGIVVQNQYMTEKVETSAFASDKNLKQMMNAMEEFYCASFARGDKKKATRRLRGGYKHKSHHFSTFRSGMVLGLALPAFVAGMVQVFNQDTREDIPAWDALLFIYGLLFVPTLFSLLIGVNLLVWARSRINYSFIFELDINSQLDYREYFHTPSILLSLLCYCFWLSFAQVGSPTLWPLVWLACTAFMLFQPLPIYFRSSRYWLIRRFSKLFLSGTRRVEFTDFWMGDQFCSLIFTISNLYLFACTYANDFPEDWSAKCSSSKGSGPGGHGWLIAFALTSVPLVIRLIQSVKRYLDSKLITHLINGGKYANGIISFFFYFLWKHSGQVYGKAFVFWCLFNTCYSTYACTWDLLMDWSVLQPRAKHRFLRSELVYQHHVPLYYFAMVTNLLIRFIWVIYIPRDDSSNLLRAFVAGVLEVLRRWQWNFFRLENEHIGNMDQYRVTREVPLPYVFDDHSSHQGRDDDDDDEDKYKLKKR